LEALEQRKTSKS
jgi:uncharacterized protein Smg (DUF494 family)